MQLEVERVSMLVSVLGLQDGLRGYYKAKIEELEISVRNKTQNLRRLEAQRNELNTQGALTRKSPLAGAEAACIESILT